MIKLAQRWEGNFHGKNTEYSGHFLVFSTDFIFIFARSLAPPKKVSCTCGLNRATIYEKVIPKIFVSQIGILISRVLCVLFGIY